MRQFFILAALIVLVLAGLTAGVGFALAQSAPFRPGSALFPLQHFAEQRLARLIPDPERRAGYHLDLVERRSLDLAALAGSQEEVAALLALDEALDRAEIALAAVEGGPLASMLAQLDQVAGYAASALTLLEVAPGERPDLFAAVQAKVSLLREFAGNPKIGVNQLSRKPAVAGRPAAPPSRPTPTAGLDREVLDPMAVSFPPGSAGALHAFWPLLGKHAETACQGCHTGGQYTGTPAQCEACHGVDKPAEHYAGDCAACHTSVSWSDVHFDHTLAAAINCAGCHTEDRPADHYTGQCSACHTSTAWKPATFDHEAARAVDCGFCHSKNKPANHFSGQCSLCHSTRGWTPASFNHAAIGATDCQSCHSRPANHFNGQCSGCHTTNGWTPARFDHQLAGATDCQSCHQRPENHFAGQCSSCHSTSSWRGVNFDHQAAGATDCQSCHAPPENHFAGQCSACHGTSTWEGAKFDHQLAGAVDC